MKLLTLIATCFVSLAGYSQGRINSYFINGYNCQQGGVCNAYGGGYRQGLIIQFDEYKLKWTKNIFEGFTVCDIRKKTESYIVALLDELYVYADLKSKSIFYIDFVNNKYQTWGYGPEDALVNKRVKSMITMLENHATQKDVVQFLIGQTIEKQ
ncbi:MAG: hypothetical protein AAFX57_05575 [Bacteroidota bacterium]